MFTPRSLASPIDLVARKALGKQWQLYAGLLGHWREIVGDDYAETTTPVKISFPHGKGADEKWAEGGRTGGTLQIRLPQGLTMEFTYRTDQIRQRVNGFFGYAAIDRIVLEASHEAPKATVGPPGSVDPARQTALREQLKDMENDDLRQALQKLGEVLK